MSMEIIIIAAVAANGIIGNKGAIPWHSREDLQLFKSATMGYPLIMGRKTFESLGKPLKGRLNIVITRNADFKYEHADVKIFHDVKSALEYCLETQKIEKVFIIGGGEIYGQTIEMADRLRISSMKMDAQGDTYFPEIDRQKWIVESEAEYEQFTLINYVKKHMKGWNDKD